ncbi:MAG: histidine kinase [Burkholderiales bacterium]|nr:histidine kinase [Burkholderiales bacterium]
MTQDDTHPFASYPAAATLRSLLLGSATVAVWSALRSPFLADLAGLLLAYATATAVLCSGRRSSRPNTQAAVAALALFAGMFVALLWQHYRPHGLSLPEAGWHATAAGGALALLVLPTSLPRWLSWRERQALAEQAAQHATERALLEARLAALQGQIEPHFLYNTLANVQYLVRRDAEGADAMLAHLIIYLRTTMPDMRQTESTIGRELTHVRAYLDIMQIRMGKRLRYVLECPQDLEHAMAPTLTLATLVENALKHGLEPKPGGGGITVAVQRDGDILQLTVADDGAGFSEKGGSSTGVGLRNLRERLSTRYGSAAELRLEAGTGGGVVATMRLPLIINEENDESERPDRGGRTAAARTAA